MQITQTHRAMINFVQSLFMCFNVYIEIVKKILSRHTRNRGSANDAIDLSSRASISQGNKIIIFFFLIVQMISRCINVMFRENF